MQCPACRHFNGEIFDPDINAHIEFNIKYVNNKDYNVEDSKLGKAFEAHSMNSDEKILKLEMQYEIRRLVRSSAARIAAKRTAGLEQIKMEGYADGFHAAQTKYVQQLTELEEKFKRQLTEQEENFNRQGACG